LFPLGLGNPYDDAFSPFGRGTGFGGGAFGGFLDLQDIQGLSTPQLQI